MLTTIGYIVSVVLVLVAISLLQRERTRAREERRPQSARLRGIWVTVMLLGLVALLFFTLQR